MHHIFQDWEIHNIAEIRNIEAYETKYTSVQKFGIGKFFLFIYEGFRCKSLWYFKEKKKHLCEI